MSDLLATALIVIGAGNFILWWLTWHRQSRLWSKLKVIDRRLDNHWETIMLVDTLATKIAKRMDAENEAD